MEKYETQCQFCQEKIHRHNFFVGKKSTCFLCKVKQRNANNEKRRNEDKKLKSYWIEYNGMLIFVPDKVADFCLYKRFLKKKNGFELELVDKSV